MLDLFLILLGGLGAFWKISKEFLDRQKLITKVSIFIARISLVLLGILGGYNTVIWLIEIIEYYGKSSYF